MTRNAVERVVVVGAGHAGLCVVSALRHRGVACTVIDVADRLGDVWRHRYAGLRLNTERDASTTPDTTLAVDVGRWPTSPEWADHIESAAEQLAVRRINERVEQIARSGSERLWTVTTDATRRTAEVVVATGRNRVPEFPPGRASARRSST